MWDEKCTQFFCQKPERKKPSGKLGRKWRVYEKKEDLRELEYARVDSINLTSGAVY
jgi:hypothetical protein